MVLNNVHCHYFLEKMNHFNFFILKNAENWHLQRNVCFQNKYNIKLVSPAEGLPTILQDSLSKKKKKNDYVFNVH